MSLVLGGRFRSWGPTRSRAALLAGVLALCLLAGILVGAPTASAATGRVYEVPNLAKPGVKPSISVRVVLPKGVRYVPEYAVGCYAGDTGHHCGAGGWFQGGGYSAARGKTYGQVGTAGALGDISAWGFGWQRAVPPKCYPEWNITTVGDIHSCQAYCISLVITCYYHTWSAFSPIDDQVEELWKPAAHGGYLYLGVDFRVKLRNVETPDFSNRVFTEALAIITDSNRVG